MDTKKVQVWFDYIRAFHLALIWWVMILVSSACVCEFRFLFQRKVAENGFGPVDIFFAEGWLGSLHKGIHQPFVRDLAVGPYGLPSGLPNSAESLQGTHLPRASLKSHLT